MKKYFYIFLIFMGLFSSCELEMIPEDTMSPETYFNSAKQLEMWCNGYYTQLEAAASVAASNADDNIDNQ